MAQRTRSGDKIDEDRVDSLGLWVGTDRVGYGDSALVSTFVDTFVTTLVSTLVTTLSTPLVTSTMPMAPLTSSPMPTIMPLAAIMAVIASAVDRLWLAFRLLLGYPSGGSNGKEESEYEGE